MINKGPFNDYVDKMRGEGVKKCVFLSTLGIKTFYAGEGGGHKMA